MEAFGVGSERLQLRIIQGASLFWLLSLDKVGATV
jgi:hypothetical protein